MGRRRHKNIIDDGGMSESDESGSDGYSNRNRRYGDGDYDISADLNDEAMLTDPSRHVHKHGRSKEDTIYGVFAAGNSSSNNDFSHGGSSRRRSHNNASISFVKADVLDMDIDQNEADQKNMESDSDSSSSTSSDDQRKGMNTSDGDDSDDNEKMSDRQRRVHRGDSDYIEEDQEDEDDDRPSFGGLGLVKPNTLLAQNISGSTASSTVRITKKATSNGEISHSSLGNFSNEPATHGSRKTKEMLVKPSTKSSQLSHTGSQIGNAKTSIKPAKYSKPDANFATFERHTKGFGSKMLAKMGYVPGTGLGANRVGIIAPIDVKLRPSGMGLGHGGFDERTETVKREKDEQIRDDKGNDVDQQLWKKGAKKDKQDGWKRNEGTTRKSAKPRFKTAQDLLQEHDGLIGIEVISLVQPTKIIDMTSKQARVLSNISEASQKAINGPDMSGRLPELRHNLLLIKDLAQSDLLYVSRKKHHESTLETRQRSDANALEALLKDERTRLERLGRIRELVGQCRAISISNPVCVENPHDGKDSHLITAEQLYKPVFEEMQKNYMPEYKTLGLDGLIVATLMPWFKAMLCNWSVLENPTFGADVVKRWKRFLVMDGSECSNSATKLGEMHLETSMGEDRNTMAPFESMLYTIWLPKVRQAINNDWNVYQPDSLVAFFEAWNSCLDTNMYWSESSQSSVSILPTWLFQNIACQLVIPKLKRAVDMWEPHRDKTSDQNELMAHTWLHPWLPILGDLLEPFWTEVRRKLEYCWKNWNPKDHTPLQVIKLWTPVFSKADLEHILTTCILPALIVHLRTEFKLSPANQDLGPLLHDVFPWCHVIPPALFSHLIATEFFAPWCRMLWTWIASPSANLEEVSNWYVSWKNVFEEAEGGSIRSLPCVADGWRTALDMMNQGVALRADDGSSTKIPTMPTLPASMHPLRAQSGKATAYGESTSAGKLTQAVSTVSQTPQLSFQDYVEVVASEHNVVFVPALRDHAESGKPIYRLGKKLMVYIDNGVLFVLEMTGESGQKEWRPISVENAISMANQ
ncbi:hypothetical protein O5D80_008155 [Batrachochytrium dendrobatidis]|nr:hypothetical protein O5D80_008155 [Batrachochytrium dendrobatidis]